jgi:thiamine-phosphate pyrophosphorylase
MKLYALCDQQMLDSKGVSVEEFVKTAISHDAKVIQYRDKISDISSIKNQLIKIRKLYDGFLIVNDKYELVEFCDGVHIGQEDLKEIDPDKTKAVKILRSVIKKDKLLGLSTHNEKEILQANEMDLNYIGLGAYRSTSTKKDISGILGKKVEELALKSNHPVAVIGGVSLKDEFENISYKVIGSGLLG